jgi:hypothetical protein
MLNNLSAYPGSEPVRADEAIRAPDNDQSGLFQYGISNDPRLVTMAFLFKEYVLSADPSRRS